MLPEYVLAFIIHMLAHDAQWNEVDNDSSIHRVKQCLWFVMEPILKLNENSSFIRKLLEKIKHAQDALEPTNAAMNEKLYICCDIALGLLISKQASYDLKEYPVELKLPRTRYLPAPNSFFNPDFANILLENPRRVLIQFSPTHKSKQMILNFMPAPLVKGHVCPPEHGTVGKTSEAEPRTHKLTVTTKPKKHVAKIVIGFPEIESEGVSCQKSAPDSAAVVVGTVAKKRSPTKRKNVRSESPISEMEELGANATSVTKRGRICKPNVRVMKDMIGGHSRKVTPSVVSVNTVVPESSVRLEATISVNLERIQYPDIAAANHEDDGISLDESVEAVDQSTKEESNKRRSTTEIEEIEIIEIVAEEIGSAIAQTKIRRTNKRIASVPRRSVSMMQMEAQRPAGKTAKITTGKGGLGIKNVAPVSVKVATGKGGLGIKNAAPVSAKIKDRVPVKIATSKRGVDTRKLTPSPAKQPNKPVANSGRSMRSSQEALTNSTNSVVLKELTKRVLTRKASSMRIGGQRRTSLGGAGDNFTNIVPVLDTERSSKDGSDKKNRKKTTLSSPSVNGTPKSGRRSLELGSVKSSPLDIVSRSKRVASQAATDQLVKRSRIM